jgi:hypothetical protein
MKKTILLLFILFSINNFAQKNPENQLGAWYMYNGSHTLSDSFSLKSMAHFRFFDFGNDLQQFIGRVGGNYKINQYMSATLGYAFLNTDTTFDVDAGDFNEHRIYEDFNIKHKVSQLGFAHRFRAEQRFFNATTGHFIRYQLSLSYPISDRWSTYVYDEIFFDFDGEAFNQNWLGFGFSYKTSNKVKLKFGYQKISLNNNNTDLDRLLLGIVLSTDHRTKK